MKAPCACRSRANFARGRICFWAWLSGRWGLGPFWYFPVFQSSFFPNCMKKIKLLRFPFLIAQDLKKLYQYSAESSSSEQRKTRANNRLSLNPQCGSRTIQDILNFFLLSNYAVPIAIRHNYSPLCS